MHVGGSEDRRLALLYVYRPAVLSVSARTPIYIPLTHTRISSPTQYAEYLSAAVRSSNDTSIIHCPIDST